MRNFERRNYPQNRYDNRRMSRRYDLHEDEDIDIEDAVIDDIEEMDIDEQLKKIGDNLGYDFTGSNGSGSFSISDNVEVAVRYTNKEVSAIETRILKRPANFNCLKNTTAVDNLSVELQTCVLIIKDIKSKLRDRA